MLATSPTHAQVAPESVAPAPGASELDKAVPAVGGGGQAAGSRGEDAAAPLVQQPFVIRWLTTLTILGCAAGVGLGCLCQVLSASEDTIKVISFPGELFIRALKAMVLPMIFSSMVVSASATCQTGAAGAVTSAALRYYLSTTLLAALEGLAWFNAFRFSFSVLGAEAPVGGAPTANATRTGPPAQGGGAELTILDTMLNLGYDLVPDNLVGALLEAQLLGVVTFAIFFGVMLRQSTPHAQMVIHFFDACFETFVAMIRVVIYFTPLGVGSMVAGSLAGMEGLGPIFNNLGMMVVVVIIGQCFHVFGVYSAIYLVVTKKNPLKYFAGLPQVWLTAFGTSSSAATLSTTIRCCTDLGVSKEVANLILPIGCTINMDGGAVEKPIVVLWIAYVAGHPLPLAKQLVVALTAMLLSIGGSPIPSAGTATLVLMVEAVGVPNTRSVQMLVSLCLAVEWLLDRIRTTVNVTGDCVGAAVTDHRVRARRAEPEARREGPDP